MMSIKNNLAKAEIYYQEGEFEQAIYICQKILEKKSKLFNALQIKAACYQGLGELTEALSIFHQLIAINDKHASTYNNIGNIYLQQNKITEAKKFYQKAQNVAPQMAEASNNLGICNQKLGDFSLAQSNYKKAITLDGKIADYHYNLGVLYADLGYFDSAINTFLKTLELNKNKSSVYWHVVKCYMYQHRYQDALEVIDMGLLSKTLSDDELCELLVAKAMLFWLFYSPDEVEHALQLSRSIYSYENDSHNMNNMIIFHRYISTLLQRRKEKQFLYQQNVLSQQETLSIKPIYFISESHGFSPNDTLITYQKQRYVVRSLFIFGAKIIHFIKKQDNRYKASLNAILSDIPKGSKLVMGFGEIDCRINEGIFVHCAKRELDFHDVIDDMLMRYVSMLQQQADNLDIEFLIYGVPAPHPFYVKQLKGDDKTQFKQLIAYFNQCLASLCDQFGFTYLDVYQLTQLNKESNLVYHTDEIHLKAETVSEIFEQLSH